MTPPTTLNGPWLAIARLIHGGVDTVAALKASSLHRARSRVPGNLQAMIKHGLVEEYDGGVRLTDKGRRQMG